MRNCYKKFYYHLVIRPSLNISHYTSPIIPEKLVRSKISQNEALFKLSGRKKNMRFSRISRILNENFENQAPPKHPVHRVKIQINEVKDFISPILHSFQRESSVSLWSKHSGQRKLSLLQKNHCQTGKLGTLVSQHFNTMRQVCY